jgi:endonuclease III
MSGYWPPGSKSTASLSLREATATLARHAGPPAPPPTSDAFELVLYENVAYMAPPARRREAFDLLRATVGTTPAAILAATPKALERVTAKGILAATFAKKLRACARLVADELGGELEAALDGPLDAARRVLRKFPGIGEPGAEKILLFSGRAPLLAPESNGLRVLVRLGLARDAGSYAKTYAAGRALGAGLTPRRLRDAHLLLRRHGETICKRTAPRCPECPLRARCDYARAQARGGRPAGRGGRAAVTARLPR